MSMESIFKHFSHEHTLSLFQVDADFEDPKPYRCHICALPILSTPSYTCRVHPNCNHFFVHKACTQLPQSFYHKLHQKTLYLTKPARVGESFTYEFENSSGLHLHPLVAQPVEIKSRHRSHIIAHHQLALLCREIVCRCDVCGEKENGFFFNCKECGFFIHQDCTVLPSVMKIPSHPHPFILTYSLPYVPSEFYQNSDEYNNKCSICGGVWLLPDGGVYFCGECYDLAHVSCAKPRMENVIAADTEFVHLPKEEDTMVIRSFVEKNNPAAASSTSTQITEIHPKHPALIQLEDACSSRDDDNVGVCDVCIQPCSINNTRRCGEFVAHPFCAHLLPPRFQQVFGPVRYKRLLRGHDELAQSFFNSVFCCWECQRLSNGFSYTSSYGTMYDVECAVAPKTIKHASHKQHILFLTGNRWFSKANCKLSCCNTDDYGSIYRCVVCEYSIHLRCALLPKTTRHKFDNHPLHLIMTPPPELGHFCEVCEQQMDHQLKEWYYGCHECDQYFHINCIPSVGLMSKVKFGKTHVDHKLHQHPLMLTQMLTHERNERCGHCNKIIKGFSDDHMALHCSPCHFWLHFFCAAAAAKWPKRKCNKASLQYYRR